MNFKKSYEQKISAVLLAAAIGCCFLFGPALQQAEAGRVYQIDGFYLGATPVQLGVTVEIDPLFDEKFYEAEEDDVRFFFIRMNDNTLRAYRIIKEETVSEGIRSILDNLKRKYGAPNKQQIKTSSIRPKYQTRYVTSVKNRAIWNISESQEFIAEIESTRVVYELIDHDPERLTSSRKPDTSEDEEFTIEKWDPDY